MKNVKSFYINKKIIFLLDEKRKLELLKYNKRLQNMLNLNIIDYKSFSSKYIIYEKSGIGIEYNRNNEKIIYEGEYLNGKRNGKGKEYNFFNELVFEGEYLKGKKWNGQGYFNSENYIIKDGKGYLKEYNNNEDIIFKENI